jgi:hypothetical protein
MVALGHPLGHVVPRVAVANVGRLALDAAAAMVVLGVIDAGPEGLAFPAGFLLHAHSRAESVLPAGVEGHTREGQRRAPLVVGVIELHGRAVLAQRVGHGVAIGAAVAEREQRVFNEAVRLDGDIRELLLNGLGDLVHKGDHRARVRLLGIVGIQEYSASGGRASRKPQVLWFLRSQGASGRTPSMTPGTGPCG